MEELLGNGTNCVYYYREPQSLTLRYIGRTNSAAGRHKTHLYDRTSQPKLASWIINLEQYGLLPDVGYFETHLSYEESVILEAFWIRWAHYKKAPLLNTIRPSLTADELDWAIARLTLDAETVAREQQKIMQQFLSGNIKEIDLKTLAILEARQINIAESELMLSFAPGKVGSFKRVRYEYNDCSRMLAHAGVL